MIELLAVLFALGFFALVAALLWQLFRTATNLPRLLRPTYKWSRVQPPDLANFSGNQTSSSESEASEPPDLLSKDPE
jgi:heme/copper-type cytochrome/quinol oxidase subunit 1